ncbi:MAG TPA: hypothetical protein PKY77_13925 [Phycisphaerae bacterium]|nr:hypothetical protein [Phycisphaerae bacterium]HRY67761.1 hypothetical protein [Phycisphaerae bacterium]HSA25213.1 hypothetical protein [Phycisphaerae bacterium]
MYTRESRTAPDRSETTWPRLLAGMAAGILAATVLLTTGCQDPNDWWEFRVVHDVQVDMPPITGQERIGLNRSGPAQPLQVRSGGSQVMFVGSRVHDDPKEYNDEWFRTFVIILDQPLKTGKFKVTPENGRFIASTAWSPARQPFIGLDGTIHIYSIEEDGDVSAWVEVRNMSARYGDRARWMEGPWEFKTTGPSHLYGISLDGGPALVPKTRKQ